MVATNTSILSQETCSIYVDLSRDYSFVITDVKITTFDTREICSIRMADIEANSNNAWVHSYNNLSSCNKSITITNFSVK